MMDKEQVQSMADGELLEALDRDPEAVMEHAWERVLGLIAEGIAEESDAVMDTSYVFNGKYIGDVHRLYKEGRIRTEAFFDAVMAHAYWKNPEMKERKPRPLMELYREAKGLDK